MRGALRHWSPPEAIPLITQTIKIESSISMTKFIINFVFNYDVLKMKLNYLMTIVRSEIIGLIERRLNYYYFSCKLLFIQNILFIYSIKKILFYDFF